MSNNSFSQNIAKGIGTAANKFFKNPFNEVNIGWLKLKYLKHLPAGKLRHHRLFGKKVYFYNPEELLHGLDEIFMKKIYYQHLTGTPFIIDCGSNIGLSIIYLKLLFADAEIIAFEPDEKNFDLLERNIQSFKFSNVTLHKAAVWIDNKPLQFAITGTMGSSITKEKSENTVTVKAIRLKEIMTKKIDFLKIDIEGAEYEVLKDITPELHFVNNLFIEYHGSYRQNKELLEILQLVEKNGFHFYIKEAGIIYERPFVKEKNKAWQFDVQLNIFCFRKSS